MSIDQLRTDLTLRIKQADERLLRVISSVIDAVETEFAGEDMTQWPDEAVAAMIDPTWANPTTEEVLTQRLASASAEIDRGEFVTLEDLEEEVETEDQITYKPMSKSEFYAEINESIAEYMRGEAVSLEEVSKND